ncbi:zinc-ribbon domain-containing protein [Clostridium sp. MCC353]|uniref:zinc ribbon domain-containing protein n=1 Tax=Clostridium sp. MCC353 TaxID=2592646 RepID=UPI001C02A4F7|nr:zinc ribbon domain-containing protein [Clostridium sp. MCC353]MBT9777021.1 zinc-ribbon domain-containing protein [Clostridium sp. MCC353]
MAGINQVFGHIKGKAETITSRITEPSGGQDKNPVTVKALKQRKTALIQEKQKYFGYLGMAAYELHKEKGLDFEELAEELEKLMEFDAEIQEINDQIEEREKEKMKQGRNICVNCGSKLEGKAKFCSNCGTPVLGDTVTCRCGTELKRNLKFCPNCGLSVEQLLEEEKKSSVSNNDTEEKVCICGAKIVPGQFMCMECGRQV